MNAYLKKSNCMPRRVPTNVDLKTKTFKHTLYLDNEPLTLIATSQKFAEISGIYSRPITASDSLNRFLNLFDESDRSIVEAKLNILKKYPFVSDIEYINAATPTVIVELSERTRDNEDEIYGIEYDLLNEIESNIEINIRRS